MYACDWEIPTRDWREQAGTVASGYRAMVARGS
jgi:hypothetical protein